METQEIFRVFDACQPSVAQVREYLERISGVSPFDLIFAKGGIETITNQIKHNQGELIGIVMDKTFFYARGLCKSDRNNILSSNDVFAFGRTLHPKALPMNRKTLAILRKNIDAYKKTADMLQVFGYNILPLQTHYPLFEKDDNVAYVSYFDINGIGIGNSKIPYFLCHDNIFFCSSL